MSTVGKIRCIKVGVCHFIVQLCRGEIFYSSENCSTSIASLTSERKNCVRDWRDRRGARSAKL